MEYYLFDANVNLGKNRNFQWLSPKDAQLQEEFCHLIEALRNACELETVPPVANWRKPGTRNDDENNIDLFVKKSMFY